MTNSELNKKVTKQDTEIRRLKTRMSDMADQLLLAKQEMTDFRSRIVSDMSELMKRVTRG